MFDFHIHSHFSPDSKMKMEDTIKRAIELGVKEMSFTDHIDHDFTLEYHGGIKFEFDPKDYFIEFNRLNKIYGDKIILRSGIEIGIQPHVLDKCRDVVTAYDFDFILASVHNVEKTCLTKRVLIEKYGVNGLWERYFNEMLYSVKNFNDFQVLGHIDVPKRYNKEIANSSILQYYPIIKDVYQYLIDHGKGIEVNSAGYKYYGLNDNNPSKDLLKLYHECGGEIITFGSDAHSLERVAENYHITMELLRDLGFKYICTYHKQQPIFHSL